jgi:transposase
VYDLGSGDRVWVTEGRRKADLIAFFDRLDEPVAQGIEAVAMDMWKPFESAVRESLPNAAIVFDRFHVMQQYSKIIDQVRRAEFKKAAKPDRDILVGSRYLLLKNADKLTEHQNERLQQLLAINTPLNAVGDADLRLRPPTSHCRTSAGRSDPLRGFRRADGPDQPPNTCGLKAAWGDG